MFGDFVPKKAVCGDDELIGQVLLPGCTYELGLCRPYFLVLSSAPLLVIVASVQPKVGRCLGSQLSWWSVCEAAGLCLNVM